MANVFVFVFLIGNTKDRIIRTLTHFLMGFLTKLNLCLLYSPALLISRVFSRETKHVHTKTCAHTLAALFVIAKNWKQPKCPQNGMLLSNKREQTTEVQQYGWISKAWFQVKAARHKGLQVDGSIYTTLEKAEPQERLGGVTGRNEIDHKIATSCHDRSIPCLADAGYRVSCGGYCM